MNDIETLRIAIEMAAKNGCENITKIKMLVRRNKSDDHQKMIKQRLFNNETNTYGIRWRSIEEQDFLILEETYCILFSHEFAKAFFLRATPSEYNIKERFVNELKTSIPIWQFHLMLMSKEENPLEYIRKYIKNYLMNEQKE